MKKIFYMSHDQARQSCADYALHYAPDGYRVAFTEPKRKIAQNDFYHSQIDQIAAQVTFLDRKWDADDMKRLLVDEFAEEMRLAGTPLHNDGRLTPSFDGRRIVQLGIQTRDFYVAEASQFIEFLFCFGALRGVEFKEKPALEGA